MDVFFISYACISFTNHMAVNFFKYKTEYNDAQNRQDFRANFYTLCLMVTLCFVFKLIYCDK